MKTKFVVILIFSQILTNFIFYHIHVLIFFPLNLSGYFCVVGKGYLLFYTDLNFYVIQVNDGLITGI